jgi:hypothetical protein
MELVVARVISSEKRMSLRRLADAKLLNAISLGGEDV